MFFALIYPLPCIVIMYNLWYYIIMSQRKIKNPEIIVVPDIQETLQRPDLGIETVEQARKIKLKPESYSWLHENISVPLLKTNLDGLDEPIYFGSAVKGNQTLTKLASRMSQQDSDSASRALFKGIVPFMNEDGLPPNIEQCPYISAESTIYKTSKRGKNAPRLFFTAFRDNQNRPIFIKLAVTMHDKQQQAINTMSGKSKIRRKKDG